MLPEGAAWEKSPSVPMAIAAIEDIRVLRYCVVCPISPGVSLQTSLS